MSSDDAVRERWRALMARLGVDAANSSPILGALVAGYSEPQRHYHTLDHIAALFRLLDQHGQHLSDRDAVELAILFHDAVYDPARSDNEEASAALAAKTLASLHVPQRLATRVSHLILATRHGTAAPEASADGDMALLLDLDLAILAAKRDQYAAYAAAVRREYSIYPDEVYRPGRRKVLDQFLARPRIYLTERLHGPWDGQARANLAWEMEQLG
jgi:predicted metal-dependent HD superfamily phosphohydrolase